MTNEPSPIVQSAVNRVPGTVLAVCATVVFVTIVMAFVFLAVVDADATDFRAFINTALNAGGLIIGITGAVAGGIAAKNSARTVVQTNGGLDARIEAGVQRALNARTGGSLGTES